MHRISKFLGANLVLVSSLFIAQTSIPAQLPQHYELQDPSRTEAHVELTAKDLLEIEINRLQADPILRNASWSFSLYDPVTNREILSYNDRTPLLPASTTKLLTTETAYAMLGPDYRWNTQLEYSGEVGEDGTLNGNLYIVGSGDPTLGKAAGGASSYWAIVSKFRDAIKEAGIRKVSGDIIIQNGIFKSDNIVLPPNIVWLEHNNYFLPAGSTQNIDPTKERLVVKARNLLNDGKRYFYISPYTGKQATADSFDGAGSVSVKLPDAPYYLANSLRTSLVKSGVSVAGKVVARPIDAEPGIRNYLAREESPCLEDIIYFTNQTSSNAFAEALLHSVGYLATGDHTALSGRSTVTEHLSERGYDFTGLSYSDGSGLSRSNFVTAYSQVRFLADIMKQPYYNSFLTSLPIAGQTGTLKRMFNYSDANGRIFAKTGTLNRVKTLAGYINTNSGRTLTFSLLINGYNGSVDQVKKRMEELLSPVLDL
ncbi:MAG: D-alanyl-D-alanine carboxypeptidase/D-alanyl-D-alanine-endopeptidase [Chryseobacterium sp.]|nr:MAG: D-alanyl-D-alanine carboxypeptidase/D-alanyl-D-alanine-endopeptidase [Chryseobacterium sp.]